MRPPSLAYLLRGPEEVDDLGELGLGFVDPGDVVERDRDLLWIDAARLGTAEVAEETGAAGPSRASREQHEQADEQHRRSEAEQQLRDQRRDRW